MKNTLFLIALLFFTGCSKPDLIETGDENVLYEYLDEFVLEAGKRGIDLNYIYDRPITLGFSDDTDFCGRTFGTGKRKIEIYIGKPCWDRQDDYHRRATMFHELGHDVLGLEHGQGIIMNTNTNRRLEMESLGWTWDDVLDQLFNVKN